MLVLEGLVGLHRTIQLQLLQHYWLGHRLGLLDRAFEARGSGREELPNVPKPEAKGGSSKEQPHVQGAMAAWAQEGLEELSHIEGQEVGW